MKGRVRAFMPVIRGAAVGICLVVLLGIELHAGRPARERGVTKMVTEDSVKRSSVLTVSIPPIDAEAPARTETATFALG
jgi:hypothetical protein